MTLQIGTKLFYDRTSSQLDRLSSDAQKIQTQISSGKRLTVPSDDPGAYRQLATLAQQTADDTAYAKNVTLAQTILAQADTTLGDIGSQIQRAQELAVQGNSGTLSDADRRIIATQLRGVVDDLVALANARDGRGTPLFGAATGDTAVTRTAGGTVSFTGTGNPPSIPVGENASVQPSESAEKFLGNIPAGGGTTDVFALLSSFATALETPGTTATGTAAAATLDGLKAALDNVSGARGSIGARAARLDIEQARVEDAQATREGTRSALEDTNISEAIVQLQKTSTILQATQQSLARLSQLSLFDYLR